MKPSSVSRERRSTPRLCLGQGLEVHLSGAADPHALRGELLNLSHRGALVSFDLPPGTPAPSLPAVLVAPGRPRTLRIETLGTDRPCTLAVRVAWLRRQRSGVLAGFRFEAMHPEERHRLDGLLDAAGTSLQLQMANRLERHEASRGPLRRAVGTALVLGAAVLLGVIVAM